MNIVIITGLSGAGKSYAVKFFEDMGYYCIDNMPPDLMLSFVKMPGRNSDSDQDIAFVIDIRGGRHFSSLVPALMDLKEHGISYEILFLEASTDALVNRYKESRRMHPLAEQGDLLNGIEKEKNILSSVREIADVIIDTSNISINEFKSKLEKFFKREKKKADIIINMISFGYKHGLPRESDMVFDVRFIKNPFYISELKDKTGLDKEVEDYVLGSRVTAKFISKTLDMLEFLIPKYIDEGKKQLVISIGCTGGKHRSVVISNTILKKLISKGHTVYLEHRDINKAGK